MTEKFTKSPLQDLSSKDQLVKSMRSKLDVMLGRQEEKENSLEKEQEKLKYNKDRYECGLKATVVAQEVAKRTQQKLEFHISSVVTMALAAVFPDPYEFKIDFVSRRNRTECDLLFVGDGWEAHPMNCSGGGPKDVASFALRCAFWSLNKTRATIVLDEPFRYLSRDLQPKAGELLRILSDNLGIQFIVTTHVNDITEVADRVFEVTKGYTPIYGPIATVKQLGKVVEVEETKTKRRDLI